MLNDIPAGVNFISYSNIYRLLVSSFSEKYANTFQNI